MSDETPTIDHRDLAAYALLFCILFLAISLATYDPADAIGPLIAPLDRIYAQDLVVAPPNEQIANQCGWWGALAADMLYTIFGVGAYFVIAGLTYLDFQLLRRNKLDTAAIRLIGGSLSLAGLCGCATLAFPAWTPGPVLGSGGMVGALIGWTLESQFATTGGMILCFSAIIAGLFVSTDYALYRAAALAGGAVVNTAQNSRQLFRRVPRLERPASDVEDPFANGLLDGQDEEDADVPIKIRGEVTADPEAWDEEQEESDEDVSVEYDEYDEYDEQEEAEEEEEEIVVKTPKPKRNTAASEERSEREEVFAELNEADFEEDDDYELPGLDLLVPGAEVSYEAQRKELGHKAKLLEKTFKDFGFNVKVVEIETGPVIAQYEIELEAGLRLSKITNLADDIAIALRVPSVRIVSPIPGKNTVGIEVPNAKRQMVRLRDVIEETNGTAKKMKIPLFLGQDVSGNPMTADLASLPHLLIAGRTGTGKSVCLNAIISSILMTKRPDEVRMLMIDPKMVELSGYGRLPHLMHPVVTDMKKAEAILAWAVDKMEERYSLLARAGVRHITSYNQLGEEELMERLGVESDEERAEFPQHLPFIVIVADEMADLMMTAGKEVEQHIIRLAQKSRAVGIHLILATQKPTVDVITGLIKSNLPARISFQVASRTDSRVVLDEMGAEKLLGNGDMLFLWPGTSTLLRGQGTYLGDEEIDRVVDAASTGEQNFVNELVNMNVAATDGADRMEELRKRDDLYESAIEVVVREQRGSCSLLQRSLGIGYGRAARLIDFMAEDGIVGSYAGSQAREVLVSMEDWERMQGLDGGSVSPGQGPQPQNDDEEMKQSKKPALDAPPEAPKKKPSLKKTRADAASEPQPQRRTVESVVNGEARPKRRNRIVLVGDETSWEEADEDSVAVLSALDQDDAAEVIDLDQLDGFDEEDDVPAAKANHNSDLDDDEYEEEEEEEEYEEEEYEQEEEDEPHDEFDEDDAPQDELDEEDEPQDELDEEDEPQDELDEEDEPQDRLDDEPYDELEEDEEPQDELDEEDGEAVLEDDDEYEYDEAAYEDDLEYEDEEDEEEAA